MTSKQIIWKCDHFYQSPGVWWNPGYVLTDENGLILSVSSQEPSEVIPLKSVRHLEGMVLPGFTNAHSHVFQRAMAGQAEFISERHGVDDFWSWREAMYCLALRLDADEFERIAEQTFRDMKRAGWTRVVEFHYLHNDREGKPYKDPLELSKRLLAAAQRAQIDLTLLPTLYQRGDFKVPPYPEQRRFIMSTADQYFDFCAQLETFISSLGTPGVRFGYGLHSLRAVDPDMFLLCQERIPAGSLVHIHVSEQQKEVENCKKHLGQTPIEWLLKNCRKDLTWFFVHGTQAENHEVQALAESNIGLVLCPSTEGNLGDGIFPFGAYVRKGLERLQQGKGSPTWTIGTDSHVQLNPFEELRWLDYIQRMIHKRRTYVTPILGETVEWGAYLFDQAVLGGKVAGGGAAQFFAPGEPFKPLSVPLRAESLLQQNPQSKWLNLLVYCSGAICLNNIKTLTNG